jgi:hypothetical protein
MIVYPHGMIVYPHGMIVYPQDSTLIRHRGESRTVIIVNNSKLG